MRRLALLVFAGTLLLAVLGAPSAASADVALSARIGQPIYRLEHGTALKVPVSYACPDAYNSPNGYAIVSFFVTEQLAGGRQAQGYDVGGPSAYLNCDGQSHVTSIRVTAESTAFRPEHVAKVQGDVLACDAAEEHCVDLTMSRRVRIVNMAPGRQAPSDPVAAA
jgi:hypothetical protein